MFKGEFKNGEPIGIGLLKKPDGTEQQVNFKEFMDKKVIHHFLFLGEKDKI